MKLNKILILGSLVLLCGCATQYKKQGFLGGGYTDFRMANNKFVVSFRGNEYTSSDTAMRFALLRASEITVKNGFRYFVITEKEDISKTKTLKKVDEDEGAKTEQIEQLSQPGIRLYIKCYETAPKNLDEIDAVQYISYNKY